MKPLLPLLCALMLPLAAHAAESSLQRYGNAPNAPFSAAVRAGDTLYVSGQIGTNAQGKLPDDFAQQTNNALDNMTHALTIAGASLEDVAKCTVMLTDMSNWPAFNTLYVHRFQSGKLPARSAMGATALAMGAKVEIECIAYLPKH